MINPSVSAIIESKGWQHRRYNLSHHEHLLAILLDEPVNEDMLAPKELLERKKVIMMIRAGKWDRNPAHFHASMQDSKHSAMLTHYTLDDLKKMDTYKVPGYNIGFALKDHEGAEEGGSGHSGRVEIVAVHNNSDVRYVGKELMKAAIKSGGTVLDHFDGYLSKFYEEMGFESYKSDPYNPQYDAGSKFKKKYGEQPVIYRRLKKAPDVQ